MNKVFGNLVLQFRDYFRNLGPTKRMSVIAASIVLVVALVIISVMVSGKDYAILLTNIPNDQLSSIAEKLTRKNIPFQIREDGKTIAVPKELLHATQMSLMSEMGSSKIGNVGLEIFEKQDFGLNSYAQKINYQRAVQGELMRAINTLSAVKQSKVILALPTRKTFLEENGKPSASVVLELYPGKTLDSDQVRGIQYLVANSIEGMDSDKVTVLDERGKMLTRSTDGTTAGSAELLDLKRKIEIGLEDRIDSILAKVVGHASVVVRVDATLNGKVVQAVEESVDPEKTAIRSQQSEEESLDGARTNPVGVPGSRSNLPGGEEAGQVGFKQDVKKEMKTINFDIPKTVRNIRESAGALERVSVAVLVDGVEQILPKEDGTTETKWTPRTPDELAKYESLVKSAVGFNAARGDSVKIENIRFVPEDFSESDKFLTALERKKLLYAIFKWALLGFALVLFFFIVVRPFMQWITDTVQDSVEEMFPRTIEELENLQSVDNTLPGMSAALPVLEESIDPDKAESELLKERIMAIMERDDEKVASAFGMWLVRKE